MKDNGKNAASHSQGKITLAAKSLSVFACDVVVVTHFLSMFIKGLLAFSTSSCLFKVMCVIVGNFIILNLVVAVQSAFLDKAFDEEDERK